MGKTLTLEEGRQALGVHAVDRAYKIREKYGNFIDYETLLKILKDRDFVRFPTRIEFRSEDIEEGLFAFAQKVSSDAEDGYVIYVHDYFEDKLGDVPALVLYHLVAVNYGEFATYNEAEAFASTVLGMKQEEYYELLCSLADQIPKKVTKE